ncbi:MAG: flagellar hook-length control protein FliK [Phycisphaerae bacterium]
MVNSTRIMEMTNETKTTKQPRKQTPTDVGLFTNLLSTPESSITTKLFSENASSKLQPQEAKDLTPKAIPQNTPDNQSPEDSSEPGSSPRTDSGNGVDGCAKGLQTGASTEAAVNAQPNQGSQNNEDANSSNSTSSDQFQQLIEHLITGATPPTTTGNETEQPKLSAKPIEQHKQVFSSNLNLPAQNIIFETGLAEHFIRLLTDQFEQIKNSPSPRADNSNQTAILQPISPNASESQAKISTPATPQTQVSGDDAAESMNRIVQVIRSNLGRRQSQMTVQLDPPELGKLRIDVKLIDNNLQMSITTETNDARQIILDRMDTLRANLERGGINMSKFEVVTKTPDPRYSQNWQQDPNHSQSFNQQQQQGSNFFQQEKFDQNDFQATEESNSNLTIPAVQLSYTALNLVA